MLANVAQHTSPLLQLSVELQESDAPPVQLPGAPHVAVPSMPLMQHTWLVASHVVVPHVIVPVDGPPEAEPPEPEAPDPADALPPPAEPALALETSLALPPPALLFPVVPPFELAPPAAVELEDVPSSDDDVV